MKRLKKFFEKRNQVLWHPDSPGIRVNVRRTWFQRLIYPKDFATLGECIANYRKERSRPR